MRIVILGAGHVATHYAIALKSLGHQIDQIYSRTSAHAIALAEATSGTAIHNISKISTTADLYVIAVSDNAIAQIATELPSGLKGIVVHTSGATHLSVLNRFDRSGVIYPLQSLSKNVETDLSLIPFAIEGNNLTVAEDLLNILLLISPRSFLCTSTQRLTLHIAAVFVNNFPNALYQIAYDLLVAENLDFELLRPIILETAQKVQHEQPKHMQTGPATRNDTQTLATHLQFLSQDDQLRQIYQDLTGLIMKKR